VTRRTWAEIKRERIGDPEIRAGYERARLAFELGEQVRRLREARGMSQQELARRAGTSQPAIARLEAGGVDPRLETLHRLGRALDADLVLRFQPHEAPAATH
jgi:ribosome-binding protein aMBF1 (putative translation factor)